MKIKYKKFDTMFLEVHLKCNMSTLTLTMTESRPQPAIRYDFSSKVSLISTEFVNDNLTRV